MRGLAWSLVAALALGLSGRGAAAQPFDRDDLHSAFLSVAFGVELQDAQSRPGIYIRKFAGSIRYSIRSHAPGLAAEVEARLTRIRDLIGLDLAPAGPGETPNYFVYIYPEAEKRAQNRAIMTEQGYSVSDARLAEYDRAGCRFSIFPDPAGIQKSLVFLPHAEGPDWAYCLSEELLQAFGLLNDTDTTDLTVFNERRDSHGFAPFDLYLLALLSDDRIAPGMELEAVRAAFAPDLPAALPDLPMVQLPLDLCRPDGDDLICAPQ